MCRCEVIWRWCHRCEAVCCFWGRLWRAPVYLLVIRRWFYLSELLSLSSFLPSFLPVSVFFIEYVIHVRTRGCLNKSNTAASEKLAFICQQLVRTIWLRSCFFINSTSTVASTASPSVSQAPSCLSSILSAQEMFWWLAKLVTEDPNYGLHYTAQ